MRERERKRAREEEREREKESERERKRERESKRDRWKGIRDRRESMCKRGKEKESVDENVCVHVPTCV